MSGWRSVWRDLLADCRQFNELAVPVRPLSWWRYVSILLRPEVAAMALYRYSHYWHAKGVRPLANALYRFNLTMTGADISPESKIGPGCVIVHTVGTVIHGTLGANALLTARVIISGSQPGGGLRCAPQLGDSVTVGSAVAVLGPVIVPDNVTISALSLIDESIPEGDCVVRRIPGRRPVTVSKKR